MERLNSLIKEYVIDHYEQYKEKIDDMATADNISDKLLHNWLFNGVELDESEEEDDLLLFDDWLKINYEEYYDTFLTAMNGFEMLEIIVFIDTYKVTKGQTSITSQIGHTLKISNGTFTKERILLQYAYIYGTTKLLKKGREGYTDILNMVEGRNATIIMPK